MKTIFTFMTIFSMIVQAQTVPNAISENKIFKLEQEISNFQLQHVEKEPVYETQEQPSTCYRTVQRGTKQECHTEYDRRCNTEMENECRSVAYPICENVSRRVCENVPRRSCHLEPRQKCQTNYEQVCHNESRNVCENVPRRQCSMETRQQCTTVQDKVCHGQGAQQVCQTVPRRQCSPVQEQVCKTVNDQVCHTKTTPVCQSVPRQSCHTENEQVCRTENDQVCHSVNEQQCHNEYRQECRQVPREHCTNIPREACEMVPNMEEEPYSCMKPVQVQVGERVKLSVLSNVKIQILNFGKTPLSQDEIIAELVKTPEGSDVSLKLGKNDQKTIYRIVKKERVVQLISDTESIVNVTFILELISVDELNEMKNLKIIEPKVFSDKIQFKLSANPTVLFDQGTLNVLQEYRRRIYVIIDQAFDPSLKIKKVADHYEIPVSGFGVRYLENANHQVKLELKLKALFEKNELLNPELLDQITLGTLHSEFQGYPEQ